MHSWLDIGSRHQMLVVSQVVTMRMQSVCAWMARLPLWGWEQRGNFGGLAGHRGGVFVGGSLVLSTPYSAQNQS